MNFWRVSVCHLCCASRNYFQAQLRKHQLRSNAVASKPIIFILSGEIIDAACSMLGVDILTPNPDWIQNEEATLPLLPDATITLVTRSLSISVGNLYRWIKEHQPCDGKR